MDWSRDWAYFPMAVFANVIFLFIFYRFVKKEEIRITQFSIWFLSSAMMTWGLDVLQRHFEATRFEHVFKISFGCWFLLILSSYLRQQVDYKSFWLNFKKDIRSDLGIDLLSFFIIGIVVFVLT